jgi:hypothetical protein
MAKAIASVTLISPMDSGTPVPFLTRMNVMAGTVMPGDSHDTDCYHPVVD